MSFADVQEKVEEELDLKRPNLWRVIFHNDNKTTMEFVVLLLLRVFHKSEQEAMDIMLQVHEKGQAIVGVYTHEIAENKMEICINTAKDYDFPLRVTIEEEL
ncbi:MAG: ATP-dependent Clp protease adaptor ClpS [Gammaproteobacteria bacterium]|nr:ATP-dependent Clp protease adaptor ClpS [Gammaproteobacteria bacterium]